jgi:Domain of unknown function (DUF4286)
MYIFSTTFNISEERSHEWLQWMEQHYIPLHMATGHFSRHVLSRVLLEQEMGGISYSLQLFTPSRHSFEQYQLQHQSQVEQHIIQQFGGHYVQFQLLLEVLQHGNQE